MARKKISFVIVPIYQIKEKMQKKNVFCISCECTCVSLCAYKHMLRIHVDSVCACMYAHMCMGACM